MPVKIKVKKLEKKELTLFDNAVRIVVDSTASLIILSTVLYLVYGGISSIGSTDKTLVESNRVTGWHFWRQNTASEPVLVNQRDQANTSNQEGIATALKEQQNHTASVVNKNTKNIKDQVVESEKNSLNESSNSEPSWKDVKWLGEQSKTIGKDNPTSIPAPNGKIETKKESTDSWIKYNSFWSGSDTKQKVQKENQNRPAENSARTNAKATLHTITPNKHQRSIWSYFFNVENESKEASELSKREINIPETSETSISNEREERSSFISFGSKIWNSILSKVTVKEIEPTATKTQPVLAKENINKKEPMISMLHHSSHSSSSTRYTPVATVNDVGKDSNTKNNLSPPNEIRGKDDSSASTQERITLAEKELLDILTVSFIENNGMGMASTGGIILKYAWVNGAKMVETRDEHQAFGSYSLQPKNNQKVGSLQRPKHSLPKLQTIDDIKKLLELKQQPISKVSPVIEQEKGQSAINKVKGILNKYSNEKESKKVSKIKMDDEKRGMKEQVNTEVQSGEKEMGKFKIESVLSFLLNKEEPKSLQGAVDPDILPTSPISEQESKLQTLWSSILNPEYRMTSNGAASELGNDLQIGIPNEDIFKGNRVLAYLSSILVQDAEQPISEKTDSNQGNNSQQETTDDVKKIVSALLQQNRDIMNWHRGNNYTRAISGLIPDFTFDVNQIPQLKSVEEFKEYYKQLRKAKKEGANREISGSKIQVQLINQTLNKSSEYNLHDEQLSIDKNQKNHQEQMNHPNGNLGTLLENQISSSDTLAKVKLLLEAKDNSFEKQTKESTLEKCKSKKKGTLNLMSDCISPSTIKTSPKENSQYWSMFAGIFNPVYDPHDNEPKHQSISKGFDWSFILNDKVENEVAQEPNSSDDEAKDTMNRKGKNIL
ncbi:hypothetical protein HK103_006801 [Boothiomyces macroporosus]|uniref:Transmembrane protein n=1 Tax=Boothiomyces macroporosus TaxID=261099 RepID=A0AAD5UGH2_9FUNG|nr:hypothetical protein HK103_006801 [Boothiomyces macroporosus]